LAKITSWQDHPKTRKTGRTTTCGCRSLLPKDPQDRKDYHLRVPLTAAQLAVIEAAARLEDEGKAGWARSVLLAAAKKRIDSASKSGRKPT
jgi:hypothetical protein